MNKDRFWNIIAATTPAKTGEEQLALLRNTLEPLPDEDIIAFNKISIELHFAAYCWDLWLVAWLCDDWGCSDDGFSDFRSWLVSRGRAIYEMGMNDADRLAEEIERVQDARFELFGSVAGKLYRQRTGQNLPRVEMSHPREPSGGAWLRAELKNMEGRTLLNRCVIFDELGDEDFDVISKAFPKTWNLSLKRGIMQDKG